MKRRITSCTKTSMTSSTRATRTKHCALARSSPKAELDSNSRSTATWASVLAFHVADQELKPSEKPLPKLRPGWALIRIRLAGICNTDIEILRGYHSFRGTPGHEFVGEVARVRGLSAQPGKRCVGQRVPVEINVSCAAYGYRPVCAFCRRGLKTHCANRTVLGIVAHDGAF